MLKILIGVILGYALAYYNYVILAGGGDYMMIDFGRVLLVAWWGSFIVIVVAYCLLALAQGLQYCAF